MPVWEEFSVTSPVQRAADVVELLTSAPPVEMPLPTSERASPVTVWPLRSRAAPEATDVEPAVAPRA
jgi:hypothetical protein